MTLPLASVKPSTIKVKFPDGAKAYAATLGRKFSNILHKTRTDAEKYSIRWYKTAERFLK